MKKELTEIYVNSNTAGKTYEDFEKGMDRDNSYGTRSPEGPADEIINPKDEDGDKESTT